MSHRWPRPSSLGAMLSVVERVEVTLEEGAKHCTEKTMCARCRAYKEAGGEEVNHVTREPARPFLSIDAAGSGAGFSGYVAAEHVHMIIARLTLLRDRMVADGALPPARDAVKA